MTNWHFRLRTGGIERSYYIIGSDKELALLQAQEALYEECKDMGFTAFKADILLEERMEI